MCLMREPIWGSPDLGETRTESKSVKGIGGYSSTSIPLYPYWPESSKRKGDQNRHPESSRTNVYTQRGTRDPIECSTLCTSEDWHEQSPGQLETFRHPYFRPRRSKVSKRYDHVCHIAKKWMERYMERTGETDKEPKQCSIKDVVIAEDFTPEQRNMIKSICKK